MSETNNNTCLAGDCTLCLCVTCDNDCKTCKHRNHPYGMYNCEYYTKDGKKLKTIQVKKDPQLVKFRKIWVKMILISIITVIMLHAIISLLSGDIPVMYEDLVINQYHIDFLLLKHGWLFILYLILFILADFANLALYIGLAVYIIHIVIEKIGE